jgi:hypothetical protein
MCPFSSRRVLLNSPSGAWQAASQTELHSSRGKMFVMLSYSATKMPSIAATYVPIPFVPFLYNASACTFLAVLTDACARLASELSRYPPLTSAYMRCVGVWETSV